MLCNGSDGNATNAANGVVLVTTKRGQLNQDSRVDAKTYYGWQNWGRFPMPANAGAYVRAQAEADMNQYGETGWSPEELARFIASEHKYWGRVVKEADIKIQ